MEHSYVCLVQWVAAAGAVVVVTVAVAELAKAIAVVPVPMLANRNVLAQVSNKSS